MDKAKKKGKGKKKGKKQTIDLTLRMNVELQQGKQQPRKERVKRITSRKRQNLREMRQSLPGAGGPQAFANPAFYGNVKMLNNAALNQFQNQRYSLEQQVRESSAEQKALLAAGRADAAQQAAQALATQAQQLTNLQQRFGFQSQQLAAVSAAAGVEQGKAVTLQQQHEQQAIEQQYAAGTQAEQEAQRKARLAEVRAYSDERLKEEASQLPGLKGLDFSPQAFSKDKFRQTKYDIVKVLALGDPDDTAALVDQFKATHRAQGRTESREKQVQALRLQAKKGEGTPKKAVRGYGSEEEEEEEEEDVVYGSADEYESE